MKTVLNPGPVMKKTIQRADSRGLADHGWLKSKHSFSFADYYNPERMGFGLLRVLNDDWVAPSGGFATHPHSDMEIVSIPLRGALRHKDSMGNESVIRAGEVQRLSAGTGVAHSEYNASDSEPSGFLQIWVLPRWEGLAPGYGQKKFDAAGRKNRFQTVIAPDERDGAVGINQDAYFSLLDLDAGQGADYGVKTLGNGVYLLILDGRVEIAGEDLDPRDAVGIEEAQAVAVRARTDCRVLAIEVPMSARAV